MVFSSPEFLFLFLPLALLCVGIGSLRLQNLLLLGFSLLFYAMTDPTHFLLFVGVILYSYLAGLWLSRFHTRVWTFLSVLPLAVNLFLYKYFGTLTDVLMLPVALRLVLPVGISFYTFQSLSYLFDVARGDIPPERSIFSFALYLSLFPQLVAGPIVRYTDVMAELSERTPDTRGMERFMLGLAKKVLVADAMGEIFLSAQDGVESSAILLWLGLFAAAFQIYFDFSGYSDMAIGIGRMLGFRFPENFDYPYTARSATEFWRRWHITLTSFFRAYVYIPLGGNRKGRLRTALNLAVVWALTGLWHGPTLNFLLWGLYWLLFQLLEKFCGVSLLLSRLPRVISHFYTVILILFGWLLFFFTDLSALVGYTKAMFSMPFLNVASLFDLLRLFPVFLCAALLATPLPMRLYRRIKARRPSVGVVLPLFLFLLSVSFLLYRAYSPFLYFRF